MVKDWTLERALNIEDSLFNLLNKIPGVTQYYRASERRLGDIKVEFQHRDAGNILYYLRYDYEKEILDCWAKGLVSSVPQTVIQNIYDVFPQTLYIGQNELMNYYYQWSDISEFHIFFI